MNVNPGVVGQPPAVQTIGDILGLGSSRKSIFIFIAIGALLLALAMRFGFLGFGNAATTMLGVAALKRAVPIHTGPPPSFAPDVGKFAPSAVSATLAEVSEVGVSTELPIEELTSLGGVSAEHKAAAAVPLEEVAIPAPTSRIPTIVPSGDMQEVEVLC